MFFDFLQRRFSGAVVGHGGGGNKDVAGHGSMHGLAHLQGRFYADAPNTLGSGQVGHAANEHHFSASIAGGCRDGVAHAPGAAVADKAHWVERFTGGSGGNDHALAVERLCLRSKDCVELSTKLHRLQHASYPDFTAGLLAGGWAENARPALDECLHIGLGGGVRPHDPIHGRSEQQWCFAGQTKRAQQVIGHASGEARHHVGAGRGDKNSVCPARQFDMPHGGFVGFIP